MREILFKAKREDNGEWLYWNEFGRVIDIKTDKPLFINTKPAYINHYDITEETVCQYTGLLDKHGVKIFEGDIIKGTYTTHDKNILPVVYNKKYDIGANDYEYIFHITGFMVEDELLYDDMVNGKVEVIGNIHDKVLNKEIEE